MTAMHRPGSRACCTICWTTGCSRSTEPSGGRSEAEPRTELVRVRSIMSTMVRSRTSSVKSLTAAELREEDVDITFLVWAVARSTTDLMDTALQPSGLTGDEFAIYSMLAASSGVTPRELARWMAAPATTVSSYVKRFESRCHIERVPHPEDGRSYRIRLSTEGRRVRTTAGRLFTPIRTGVAAALGGQQPSVRD